MSNTADLSSLTRTLKEGAQALGLTLSEAQIARLMAYQALLAKWNKVYNLTALRDPAQMVSHHLLDSLSAMTAFAGAQRVLDVGAGGGLPGIVLAIWAAEAEPQMFPEYIRR
jgi:16S rRNA (guanine527-N7)-methyltransferase